MYRLKKSDGTSNYIYPETYMIYQICQTVEKQIERNFKQQIYHQQYKVFKQFEMAEIVDRLLPSGVKWYRLSFVSTWFNFYCDSSK